MAYNNLIDLTRLDQFLGKIKLLLAEKVDKETGKGLSTNDYTTAEKNKLGAIEAEANKTIVDSALSTTSTNPVQNQAVKNELDSVRGAAEDSVIISDTQPTSTDNKLWVDDDVGTGVQIPTYAELQALQTVVAGKVSSEAGKGLSSNDYTDTEKTKLAGIAAGAQVNTVTGIKGDSEGSYRTGNVNITKGNIGLGNVENKSSETIRGELTKANVTTALGYTPPEANTTYDAMSDTEAKTGTATTAKLISAEVLDAAIENKGYITSHQDISGKLDSSLKGAANGLAELDAQGKVPSSQLPSYVDDVIECNGQASFPATGETGKVYVDTSTNKTYRWSGSAYVIIASDLALGETSSTAYRGDYGAAAYAHGVTNKGSAFESGLYKITTNAEGHVTAATAVQKSDITALGISGTVDSSLSASSENPVQNKVVKAAIDAIDEEVILSSTQPSSTNNKLWVDDTASGVSIATYAELEALEAVVDTKVTAESGKGLSSNDYTTAEKTKLAGIGTGAAANVIETIKKNGTALTVTGKAVDIAVPTKTSDLTNDSNFAVDANYVHTDSNFTAAEKTKLSNIDTEANKTVVDSSLSGTSTNPVQNKVVKAAIDAIDNELIVSDTQPSTTDNVLWVPETLGNGTVIATYAELQALSATVDGKVTAESGKGLSTNDFTTAEKTKLAGIGEGATKTVIDSALSNSSENPVQNKVVKAALDQLEKEVIVSDTQPTATTNQVWINESLGTGVPMATYAELLALQDEVTALAARVTALEQA